MKRVIAAVVALAMMSGCSFVLVRGPQTDEPEPTRWPSCTETNIFPLGDLAYAGIGAAGSIALLNSKDDLAPLAAIFLIPATIALATSAYYGYTRVTRCQDARAAYERAAAEGR